MAQVSCTNLCCIITARFGFHGVSFCFCARSNASEATSSISAASCNKVRRSDLLMSAMPKSEMHRSFSVAPRCFVRQLAGFSSPEMFCNFD